MTTSPLETLPDVFHHLDDFYDPPWVAMKMEHIKIPEDNNISVIYDHKKKKSLAITLRWIVGVEPTPGFAEHRKIEEFST
ncbi:hypothetical protein T03_13120 [Trichinella britovi]|uniref:Uncharacterized protein n=1 Tax=Trichinella britovi TaxID=45882 RepID=A0A0V1CG55_TRIBR|nr:hypothetical protein T03_13120 [Trichinella britovi]